MLKNTVPILSHTHHFDYGKLQETTGNLDTKLWI